MAAYCLLALITSLPCPHSASIGFNFGDRFGSHSNVTPSTARNDAWAVWHGSSSSSKATCQPRYVDRTSAANAWKSALRPLARGTNSRAPVRMFIPPKITRRALRPLSQTRATPPRLDHPARSGGNSNRSVSSWAGTTLRRGRAAICRRMRLFFLALGVGVQVMARPLPHITQPVQRAAERVVGQPPPRGHFQKLLDQGDRPAHMRSAEVLRREGQQRFQEVLVILVQRRVAPPPLRVPQRLGVVGLAV